MGLYIDSYSRNVEATGNTVVNTTVTGILYQRSTGQIADNVVFNAASGTEFSGHLSLGGAETSVSMTNNVLYGLKNSAWTLYASQLSNYASSDYNYLFHPYVNNQIAFGPSWTRYTFASWRTFSGLETHSKTNWFTQPAGEASRGRVFVNATKDSVTFDLAGRQYLDLDQNPRLGSLTLQPFSSKVLVDNGPAPDLIFRDGFQSPGPAPMVGEIRS